MDKHELYLAHYLKTRHSRGAIVKLMTELGDDFPDKFTDPLNKVAQHIKDNGGRGDWVSFVRNNPAVEKVLKDIEREAEAIAMTDDMVKGWCLEVLKEWRKRTTISILKLTHATLKDDTDGAIANAINELEAVQKGVRTDDFSDGFDMAGETVGFIDDILSGNLWCETGMTRFDEVMGGIRLRAENAVGGLWGSGKTTLVMNWCFNAARRGVPIVYFGEMRSYEVFFREASRQLGVAIGTLREQGRAIRKGKPAPLHPDTVEKLKAYVHDSLAKLPFHHKGLNGKSLRHLTPSLNNLCMKLGREDFILVVDTIKDVPPVKDVSTAEAVKSTHADVETEILAKFPQATAIAIQHLNKELFAVRGKEIRPSIGDFEYGGQGKQHQGFILIRPHQHIRQFDQKIQDQYDSTEESALEWEQSAHLWVVKERENGSGFKFDLKFEGQYFKFTEPRK